MKIILPIIRNIIPGNIAKDLLSVQPMTGAADIFSLRVDKQVTSTIDEPEYFFTGVSKRHVFSRGWEIWYHNEWIPEDVWWKLKIKGF